MHKWIKLIYTDVDKKLHTYTASKNSLRFSYFRLKGRKGILFFKKY